MSLINIEVLQLLKGKAIPMSDGSCFVYHLTMGEIADIGLENFYRYLNLFTTNDSDMDVKIEGKTISLYDALILNCMYDFETRDIVEIALKIFTKEIEPFFDEERQVFVIDFEYDRQLNRENFDEFRNYLQLIYRTKENTQEHKMTEDEKRMADKFKKAREKLAATKAREGKKSGPTLGDIIIGLAIANHRPFEEIWSLPFYTFYEAFYCLQRKESYDTNIQSLLAGADSKKIKLVYWLGSEEI